MTDNIKNAALIYQKELLVKDAKVLRSRELKPIATSDLESKMKTLLQEGA